eukprot:SAG31_NODE_686_length_12815_cov_5.367175_3_plen_164_part_00
MDADIFDIFLIFSADIFGAADRERARKEKETLERVVRTEDQRLRQLEERKQMQRRMATEERLATLQAQMNEKAMRAQRERCGKPSSYSHHSGDKCRNLCAVKLRLLIIGRDEERRAALDMQQMAEKATREHELKLAEKQRKMMGEHPVVNSAIIGASDALIMP